MATDHIKQVLHMNEGTDETSYAKTSYIQKQVLSLTKPIKEKAIRDFYYKKQPTTTIYIADLGCSSAEENTLNLMYEFIDTINKARQELGNNNNNNNNNVPIKEYQIYLNDLPGNDFNTLFRSLRNFDTMLKQKNKDNDDLGYYCFVNGVPGSFYERLFPSNHLHVVHSSYSLHWLSQVPEGIEDNKKNVCIGRTSPEKVVKAYYERYEHDFSSFLRCRSEEVVEGGVMVLTMMGRRSTDLYIKESYNVFDFGATVLNAMVSEGLIEEEKLNNFNFPFFPPSITEIGLIVEKEGSFTINEAQISEVNWETTIQFENSLKSYDYNDFSKCMRAAAEPFIANHFGEAIFEEYFRRYTEILKVSMAKEKKNVFVNVTVWLTRKARSNGVKERI